jgi:hypothetical protein
MLSFRTRGVKGTARGYRPEGTGASGISCFVLRYGGKFWSRDFLHYQKAQPLKSSALG